MATQTAERHALTAALRPAGALDNPALYDGVLSRRVFAFLIDYTIVAVLLVPAAAIVAILGIATLGLGWLLYGILVPLVALSYVWFTLGGRKQATTGMQMMGIRLERLDGSRIDGLTAIVHSVLFWAGNVVLTPLILLATLFTDKKRTLHDLLLGTAVIRTNQ
jgi:uncharacterized RDD family membrane protein YckC